METNKSRQVAREVQLPSYRSQAEEAPLLNIRQFAEPSQEQSSQK